MTKLQAHPKLEFQNPIAETEIGAKQPLVAAVGLFLLGMVGGRILQSGAGWVLAGIGALWLGWWIAERMGRAAMARSCLGGAIFLAGMATWMLNQSYGEPMHVARLVPDREEVAVTLRARVLVPPDEPGQAQRGSRHFAARAGEILTDQGWLPAAGDIMVSWTTREAGEPLQRGDVIEAYGWLSRPPGAMNPGGIDRRKQLAADRIFAEVRVPRASGIVVIDDRSAASQTWLARMRLFLRGKLLEHMVQQDVPAAYTMTALLLGTRDPAMGDVSQAFADSGVAHLLAISGSHIVFFAGLAWALLRLVPMRPRLREVAIALMVGAYVLATPCGPPIVRAAVALAMVLLARLAGRPRDYLNMLAAAALVVVLIRPADIGDAGCQLSFVSTAGLILFAQRMYHGLFGRWLEREALVAELADTPTARRRLLLYKWALGLFVANVIGAATAAPLVALHFGQVNLWAMVAGLVALPVVSVAMVIGAMQLIAAVLWNPAAAVLGPLAVTAGQLMIWVVQHLAALPGAAVAVRPPPGWPIAGIYAVLLIWAVRRRFPLSRAIIVNALVAMAVVTSGWYAWTAPVGRLRLTVLNSGDAATLLLRTPAGDLWTLDAGAPRTSRIGATLSPALRLEGTRRLDALLLTALDASHASGAAETIERYRPKSIALSAPSWEKRGETLAGAGLAQASQATGVEVHTLHAGQTLAMGSKKLPATMEVLWPPANGDLLDRPDLIVLLSFAEKRVLIVDPASLRPLTLILLAHPELHCDAVVFLGTQRGTGDEPLRRLIAPLGTPQIIWCGRGPWAEPQKNKGEFNTEDGAVTLEIDDSSRTSIRQQ